MRKSKTVQIGNLSIGGDNPVAVESMLKSPFYNNFSLLLEELKSLEEAGCELLRVAIPDEEVIPFIDRIKRNTTIPLMADIHFSEKIALKVMEEDIDSIRINPANMKINSIKRITKEAKLRRLPIRIGVNAGSFKKPFGKGKEATSKLVSSLLKTLKNIEKEKFHDIILSIKSSDVLTTIWANEELAKRTSYPIHIGITEAGIAPEGIIKSSVGLGILLKEGIGDSLRVSLTGKSSEEVNIGYSILKALNIRRRGVDIISCPMCGRCRLDIPKIVTEIKKKTEKIKIPMKIAVMGCEVNGPGEAREADIGIAGGVGCGLLFRKGKILGKAKKEEIISSLLGEIKKMER